MSWSMSDVKKMSSYASDAYRDNPLSGELLSVGSVQCTLYDLGDRTVVAFRGTEPEEVGDLLVDVDLRKSVTPAGRVHRGFYEAYQQIEALLLERLSDYPKVIHFTGHSMGGALAPIAAFELKGNMLVPFGSPRVAGRNWARKFNRQMIGRCARVVNNVDLVSRVPSAIRFTHVGTHVLLTDSGAWIQPGIVTRMRNWLWCLMTGRFGRCHGMGEYLRGLTKCED